MLEEATRYLYSLMARLAKISRRQASGGEEDYACDIALFGLLFQQGDGDLKKVQLRMTDVSRFLMISKPAATQAVARLVDRGLIERASDASDRRVVCIQATDAGKEFFQRKLEERLACVERAVNRIGVERAAQLGALLDEFVDALVSATEEDEM